MTNRSEFENLVLHLVHKSVEIRNTETSKYGVVIKIDFAANNNSSEIEITLSIDNELVDIIEFFVWKDGGPHASIQEIETWLKNALDDALVRLGRV